MLTFVSVCEGMQGDGVRLTICQIRSSYRRKKSCKRLLLDRVLILESLFFSRSGVAVGSYRPGSYPQI